MLIVYGYLLFVAGLGLLAAAGRLRPINGGPLMEDLLGTLSWGGGVFTVALGSYAYERGLGAVWPAAGMLAAAVLYRSVVHSRMKDRGTVTRALMSSAGGRWLFATSFILTGFLLVSASTRALEVGYMTMGSSVPFAGAVMATVFAVLMYHGRKSHRWLPLMFVQGTGTALALLVAPVLLMNDGGGLHSMTSSLVQHHPEMLTAADWHSALMLLLSFSAFGLHRMLSETRSHRDLAPGWAGMAVLAVLFAGAIMAGMVLRARVELPSSDSAAFSVSLGVQPLYLAAFAYGSLMAMAARSAVSGLSMIKYVFDNSGGQCRSLVCALTVMLIVAAAAALLPYPFTVSPFQLFIMAVGMSVFLFAPEAGRLFVASRGLSQDTEGRSVHHIEP